jgi:hypothetical protein
MPFGSFRVSAWSCLIVAAILSTGLFVSPPLLAQSDSPPPTSAPTGKDNNAPEGTVKLKIQVTNPSGSPVANASVYVRYYRDGGLLHHDQLAELDLKTNQDGSVKVPPVPQGKIQIQVIAQGWHTFGEWYYIEKDEQAVTIQLKEPPHWY